MAYNNGFPVNYQQVYPQYQAFQPAPLQQVPQQIQQPQPMQQVQQVQQQGMTPPIVHADIYQIASDQDAANFPVAAGSSQMMITKDEKTIFIKTAYPNGQSTLDVYEKRPPAPVQKPVDMKNYVTRDELEKRLAAINHKTETEVIEA